MALTRAVFLDRDGVLNDLEYNRDEGQIGSPLSVRQLRVFPYAGDCIKRIQELGFKVVVISNQPGVAKGQMSYAEFARMGAYLRRELSRQGSSLDGEYYCLHHPDSRIKAYRRECDCRKPKPGLIVRAAKENGFDLRSSFFVGDALADVKAGSAAGCRTILLGHMTTFLARMIELEDAQPDYVLPSLRQVPGLLRELLREEASVTRAPRRS
jgi:D-glycero-D-manno-heptose 1,7-bisphosphate phosphatase